MVNQDNVYGDSTEVEGRLVFETTYTESGIGSFANVLFNGTYSPGQSPGITHLIGTAFGDDATVEIELGGLNVGAEYDRIVFEGTLVSLDGKLIVELIDAFMPSQSNTFQIFDFSSLTSGNTGQFNTLTLPSLSDDAGAFWIPIHYHQGTIQNSIPTSRGRCCSNSYEKLKEPELKSNHSFPRRNG